MKTSFSSWSTWKRCPFLYNLQDFKKYCAKSEAKALSFGTLLHSFLAQYHQILEKEPDFKKLEAEVEFLLDPTNPPRKFDDPFLTSINDLKNYGSELGLVNSKNIDERYSIAHAITLALEYIRMYSKPREAFSAIQTEMRVEMPFKIGNQTHTYDGVLDMIAYDGENLVVEHKTAGSLWDFSDKASLSFQKVGYIVLARHLGYNVNRVLYNGLKTALGPRDKTLLTNPEKNFSRVLVTVHDWEIEQWWESLTRDVTRMIQDMEENKFSRTKPDGCTAYGGCMFKDICKSPEELAESILKEDFTKIVR